MVVWLMKKEILNLNPAYILTSKHLAAPLLCEVIVRMWVFRHWSGIQQALLLKRTAAFRLEPQAFARHHWASRASVADMAPLAWFLLWLPTYEESCCLQLLSSSLLTRVPFDSSEPESADGLCSRVSVCISQRSAWREGCKMLTHASICVTCTFIHKEMWNF